LGGARATRDEVVKPGGFRAKGLNTVDICGLGSERHKGLAFAHGLSELVSCGGLRGSAEFEVADRFAEGPSQDLAMGRCPAELVNGLGRRIGIERRIQ